MVIIDDWDVVAQIVTNDGGKHLLLLLAPSTKFRSGAMTFYSRTVKAWTFSSSF